MRQQLRSWGQLRQIPDVLRDDYLGATIEGVGLVGPVDWGLLGGYAVDEDFDLVFDEEGFATLLTPDEMLAAEPLSDGLLHGVQLGRVRVLIRRMQAAPPARGGSMETARLGVRRELAQDRQQAYEVAVDERHAWGILWVSRQASTRGA